MGAVRKQTQYRPSLLDRIADGLLLIAFICMVVVFTCAGLIIWAFSQAGMD
jgi:hypothetical protein